MSRHFQPGDFVRVQPPSSLAGYTGRVVAVWDAPDDPVTVSVELVGIYAGVGLPFAPGEIDYAEVGERMFADLAADAVPRCDICDEPPATLDDWNGDTGNHASCEARTGEYYDRQAVAR